MKDTEEWMEKNAKKRFELFKKMIENQRECKFKTGDIAIVKTTGQEVVIFDYPKGLTACAVFEGNVLTAYDESELELKTNDGGYTDESN